MLIFVFDPLAIMLVVATNQAFEANRPKINIYGEIKPTTEPNPVQPDIVKPTEPAVEQTTATQVKRILFNDDDNSITY